VFEFPIQLGFLPRVHRIASHRMHACYLSGCAAMREKNNQKQQNKQLLGKKTPKKNKSEA